MGLLSQEMTIQEINDIFKGELRKSNIRIIGDIPFSEEDIIILVPKLLHELKCDFAFYAGHYKESLCILLVFCAQIEFDGNVYWNYVEKRLMPLSPEKRNLIRKQFSILCNRYELPEFERERLVGHAIITPIICHAGISQSLLEDYFRIYEDALQDAEQSGVLDITEGIFDHFDYRAPVYVRRFLECLVGDRALFFMQWKDVTHNLYTDLSSPDSISNELKNLYASSEDEKILIPDRFIQQYIEWRNKPEDKGRPGSKSKVQFSAPRVYLDLNCMGIFARLPQQKIYEDVLTKEIYWVIRSDFAETTTACPIFYSNKASGKMSDEATVILRPSKQYTFDLYTVSEMKPVASWTIPLGENYLSFGYSGEMIRSKYIPSNGCILIIPERFKILGVQNASEMPRILHWTQYQVLSINPSTTSTMVLVDTASGQTKENLQVSSAAKPEILGGELFANNPGLYMSLPDIRFPALTDANWKLSVIYSEGRLERVFEASNGITFSLNDIIPHEKHGIYELRTSNGKGLRNQFRVIYLPRIQVSADSGRWPNPEGGYRSTSFSCAMPTFIGITFDHADILLETVWYQEKRLNFDMHKGFNALGGRISLSLNGTSVSIPFRLAVRPLLWTLIGVNRNDQVSLTDQTIRLPRENLNSQDEIFLLLALGDLGSVCLDARLLVLRTNGTKIVEKDIQLNSWKQLRLSLSDIIATVDFEQTARFKIYLQIFSPDHSIEGQISLLAVSDELAIDNLTLHKKEDAIVVEWRESGDRTEREIVFRDFAAVWKDPCKFPISDGETSLRLPIRIFNQSLYSVHIQHQSDRSPFEVVDFSPPDVRGSNTHTFGSKIQEVDFWAAYNYKVLMFLTPKSPQLPTNPPPLTSDAEITQIAKTWLFFEKNLASIPQGKRSLVMQLYRKIAQTVTLDPITVMQVLLRDNFTIDQIRLLISVFSLDLLHPTYHLGMLHINDFQLLTEARPDIAFQLCLMTGTNLDWIVRWIGEGELIKLLQLSEGSPVVDLIVQRLSVPTTGTKRWASTRAFWGSYQEYFDFFEYYTHLSTKMMEMKEFEILNQYEKQTKNPSPKLFNQNYLNCLLSMKASDQGEELTVKSMEKYYEVSIFPRIRDLDKKYPNLMNLIKARQSEDNDRMSCIAYLIGMTVFVSALYRRQIWPLPDPDLIRLIGRIIQRFPDFYRHDLVLTEFYLLDGGK